MLTARLFRTAIKLIGKFESARECPLCGWTGFQFMPSGKGGDLLRFDATCPQCGSLERHRLAYVILSKDLRGDLGRVLHFAPEPPIQRWLQPKARDYHTADVVPGVAMHQVDIQKMQFADRSFDFVWCSHVLEHIPDDSSAIAEIARVLDKGGLAVIQVPVWGEKTVEGDLPIPDRIRVYYQDDHVRRYGADIGDRFVRHGLGVTTRYVQELDLQTVLRFGMNDGVGDEIFVLRKS